MDSDLPTGSMGAVRGCGTVEEACCFDGTTDITTSNDLLQPKPVFVEDLVHHSSLYSGPSSSFVSTYVPTHWLVTLVLRGPSINCVAIQLGTIHVLSEIIIRTVGLFIESGANLGMYRVRSSLLRYSLLTLVGG